MTATKRRIKGGDGQDSGKQAGQTGKDKDGESGKEVAKQKSAGRAKTDGRYWEAKVFKPTFTKEGQRIEARSYSARIQHLGKRHTFGLGVGNIENAGKEAAKIYLYLLANGWPATLEKFAPKYAPKEMRAATVGEFIAEAEASASVAPRTLAEYATSFRRIVSEICGIETEVTVIRKRRKKGKKGKKGKLVEVKEKRDARFDYAGGKRDQWLEKVNAVPLSRITPEKVQKWKLSYVRDHSGDNAKERSAKATANSTLRKAKGLFSKKVLPFVSKTLILPEPLPFEGVDFFPRQSMRYVSKINPGELVKDAAEKLPELNEESFKIFLLGLGAGLRAGEIDSLLWRQIDFEAGTITIEATPYFKPKSEDSAGVVEIDAETVGLLRGYHAKKTGEFVIESTRPPKPNVSYPYRRAKKAFDTLNEWLKENGVEDKKPLHTLRKEFGSQVCQEFGLYAASRALRHADVAITAAHYLDKKERVTVGLGRFLNPPEVVEFEQPEKEAANG